MAEPSTGRTRRSTSTAPSGAADRGEAQGAAVRRRPDRTLAETAEPLPAAWVARGRTAGSIRGCRPHLAAVIEDRGPRVIDDRGPRAIDDAKPAAFLTWVAAERKAGRAARTIRTGDPAAGRGGSGGDGQRLGGARGPGHHDGLPSRGRGADRGGRGGRGRGKT